MNGSTCLILGARGRFGRSCAVAFEAAGWNVRRFDRTRDDLMQVAQGCDVIVNGWNPPYHHWERDVMRFTRTVIESAKLHGASVIVPGNVYNYGKSKANPWGAQTPWGAENRLGQIRIDMERAYQNSSVQTIVVRSGDYIDTQMSGNWFDQFITSPLSKGYISYPGDRNVAHAWGYLPDVARIAEILASRRTTLDQFEDVAVPGFTLSGNELAHAISGALGQSVACRTMSWLPIRLASPIWPFGRCLLEMRYLWNHPHELSSDQLDALIPDFKPTPLGQALGSVLPYAS